MPQSFSGYRHALLVRFHQVVLMGGAIALLALTGCSNAGSSTTSGSTDAAVSSPAASPTLANQSPKPDDSSVSAIDDVQRIVQASVTLYDRAKAEDWTAAQTSLNHLKQTIDSLEQTSVALENLNEVRFESGLSALDRAIQERDRLDAMLEANQMVLTSADFAQKLSEPALASTFLLGYYGRSLDMDVILNSPIHFQTTTDELTYTWSQMRPLVATTAGESMASDGDRLIAQLQRAQSNAEYQRLGAALIHMGDRLESVFTAQISSATP